MLGGVGWGGADGSRCGDLGMGNCRASPKVLPVMPSRISLSLSLLQEAEANLSTSTNTLHLRRPRRPHPHPLQVPSLSHRDGDFKSLH